MPQLHIYFPVVENSWKRTRTSGDTQDFHTRKLGEITVFYAVMVFCCNLTSEGSLSTKNWKSQYDVINYSHDFKSIKGSNTKFLNYRYDVTDEISLTH